MEKKNSKKKPQPPTPPKKGTFFSFHLPKILKGVHKTKFLQFPHNLSSFTQPSRFSTLRDALVKHAEKYAISDIGTKLFLPQTRPTIHKMFITMGVVTFAYMNGKFAALLLRPTTLSTTSRMANFSPRRLTPFEISGITNADLFKAEGEFSQVPIQITDEICHEAQRRSSLPIKLINSIVLMDSVKSLASVQVRNSNETTGLREGDSIPSLAKIDKIQDHRIILKNLGTGQCEYIQGTLTTAKRSSAKNLTVLNPQQGNQLITTQRSDRIKNVGNTFNIKKTLRNEMLSNISEVLTQARAVQIQNPDGTLSFKMTEIVPGSIYSQLNIKDGDIVTGINGKKFTNIGELMTLFNQIANIDQFQVTLNRDGSSQTLEYNFE